MDLNREKTRVLLDVVDRGFDYMAAQRSNLQLLTPTHSSKILDADIVSKMSACLQFKSLVAVLPIDDEFVKEMKPDDFSMVQGLLSDRIRKLTDKIKSNFEIDSDLAFIVNSFFEERIAFLSDIKMDLDEMLSR
jgi:hypothetical protein